MVEADRVAFSDQAFNNFVQIRAHSGTDNSPSKAKNKDKETVTDEMYYRDVETNTKYKRES